MEHVDLTTAAPVFAAHVASAQPAALAVPALPEGEGCRLPAAILGTGTGDRAARVSPHQSCSAACALRAPPGAFVRVEGEMQQALL